jgi:2-octaprenylphenol hydroxylase
MRVWEERGTRAIDFDAALVARSELGWIVENGPLVALLWQRLRALDNVVVHTGDRLAGIERCADEVRLQICSGADSRWVKARLVIGADGARSSVRQLLGVRADTFDTGHHALATVVRTSLPHRGWAYQRFLLDGPLALLPGTQPRISAVVWSQPPEVAARRAALDSRSFCAELSAAVEGCLGAVETADRRMVFPLQQMLVSTFQPDERVLLIGDAARVLHPLAGLGANLGFEDVADLLAQLDRLAGRGDPGLSGLWQGFARRRRWRSQILVELMGGLRRIYARGDPLFGLLRNVGVGWLDAAAPLKRQIIREALGLGPLSGPPADG